MSRSNLEIAHIIQKFSKEFYQKHHPNSYVSHVLNDLTRCRTPELGGHSYVCDSCGVIKSGFNSCRNRHCPKCQGIKQALWVDDLLKETLPVKHFHIVFTIPHEFNDVCLTDSAVFYSQLFASAWETLRSFGYSKYGAESGAICVLHTWGQNLSLHPHLHCIVPSLGMSLSGNAKQMNVSGKYLYPVKQLSVSFRSHFMLHIKTWLLNKQCLPKYHHILDTAWNKDWVVFCEPSMAKAEHVIKYLGQYTHRVAITNNRILTIDKNSVTFLHKDYSDGARRKPVTLKGVEFLRRFCLHILPLRFVKIRRYGIYSSRHKALLQKLKGAKKVLQLKETVQERIKTLLGIDVLCCPQCKKGHMVLLEVIPRTRSPGTFYTLISNTL
jgi:hypothetical protein